MGEFRVHNGTHSIEGNPPLLACYYLSKSSINEIFLRMINRVEQEKVS